MFFAEQKEGYSAFQRGIGHDFFIKNWLFGK